MLELELKAVLPDPVAVRDRLVAAGATRAFAGVMRDRRYDRRGELGSRDEVLRVRRYEPPDGPASEEVAWKGPTGVTEGYKARRELAARLAPGESIAGMLAALGYEVVHAIDRHVEVYRVAGGEARIEWYPELDTLVEVEGTPSAIEEIIALSGVARDTFRSEALDRFVADFHARTGLEGRLELEPGEVPAHWPRS